MTPRLFAWADRQVAAAAKNLSLTAQRVERIAEVGARPQHVGVGDQHEAERLVGLAVEVAAANVALMGHGAARAGGGGDALARWLGKYQPRHRLSAPSGALSRRRIVLSLGQRLPAASCHARPALADANRSRFESAPARACQGLCSERLLLTCKITGYDRY